MNAIYIDQIEAALSDSGGTPLANLLNALAIIKESLGEGAWVGLYINDEENGLLRLGPFQGKEACLAIKPHKGLVGECFAENREIYSPNVNELTNYISCDPLTNSEYVCPLCDEKGNPFAVFDVDSPICDGLKDFLPFLKSCSNVIKSAPYLINFHF